MFVENPDVDSVWEPPEELWQLAAPEQPDENVAFSQVGVSERKKQCQCGRRGKHWLNPPRIAGVFGVRSTPARERARWRRARHG